MKSYLLLMIFLPMMICGQEERATQSDSIPVDSLQLIPEMEVYAKRLLMKRKIDGIEFTIEGSPLQQLNGWEILSRTPNILVKEDQLTVNGTGGVLVLINGRRSTLSPEQLKNWLENTSGSDIYSIEVITNPPAKYDAQGGAVVNIKMKENRNLGYKATVFSRYEQATYAKTRIGTMQSYGGKKMQFTGNYTFFNGEGARFNYDKMTFQASNTRWESDMRRKTTTKQLHLFGLGSSFNLDSLSAIRIGVDGQINPESVGNYFIPTNIYFLTDETVHSFYTTANNRKQKYATINTYLAYDRDWKNHSLSWSTNYGFKNDLEQQDIATKRNFENQLPSEERFVYSSKQQIHVLSNQLDYQLKPGNWSLEFGAKHSLVDNKNQLEFSNEIASQLVFDTVRSTNFSYFEQILASYLSAEYQKGKWTLKAGVRGETTTIDTKSNNPLISVRRKQFNLFPTVSLLYGIGEDQQIGLSYTKRIDRPNYSFLNPAKSYFSVYTYFQGDPYLKSSLIDQISVSYTFKDWNFDLGYSYVQFPSMEISFQNSVTHETVYNYTNIKQANEIHFSVYKDFNLTKWWKLSAFGMTQFAENSFVGVDSILYSNNVFFYFLNVTNQFSLDKQKTLSLSLGYRYNSKFIQGPFSISPSQNLFLSLSKKWLDGRLESSLFLNDILRTDKNTITAKYADQNTEFSDYRDLRSIQLNLRWNFGNQKVKDQKILDKTEEQKRM